MEAHADSVEMLLGPLERVGIDCVDIRAPPRNPSLDFREGCVEFREVWAVKIAPRAPESIADPLHVELAVDAQVDHPVTVHVGARVGHALGFESRHLIGGETVGGDHLDARAAAAATFDGVNAQHSVGVDEELHLDLRNWLSENGLSLEV